MPIPLGSPHATLSRRALLAGLGGMAVLHCSTSLTMAQTAPVPDLSTPFDFDWLTANARTRATTPAQTPPKAEGFFTSFTYDDYQAVQFNPAQSRFAGPDAGFHLHAFHLGWLFAEPVLMYQVGAGTATPITFTTDDFFYFDLVKDRVPAHEPLPGIAGFRLNAPLNRADVFDEVVAFLGASYFRAVGRGTGYGLSARGLAINTGLGQPEEFPRFSRFWIETPVPFARDITVYAALDSDSCTGAYRFVIRPGANTVMDVTARLFFRTTVKQIGIAPLTSMFLFSEKNRAEFDDFRPNVHDSDGLIIHRRDGDHIWRPLNNPSRLSESWLVEENPTAFGLMQRDRDFANYQDAVSHYERRPSLLVEPLGDWGGGAVRLVEIPTRQEINDNIVAFWVPDAAPTPGALVEYAYRLTWGALPADPTADLAYVMETRAGVAGVSGSENSNDARKFVVDFAGGMLAALPGDAMLDAVASVSGGEIIVKTLSKIDSENIWRMVLDVMPDAGETVELRAHVAGYGRKLTENWIYQWVTA
ncbi:glucans biosynthesis protein [Pseudorhodobacter antarcticus]|jgi:glucans biosynthesis protein|uniref:Glucans biosynthesis protein n=1 Tax=Pseudorhodobacter antarcticus TaxID=1077947 RepID=A0A1H8KQJ6_9RHOB|nr:glucan biosynthesis protein G [Pseudorhodobacter antarcticus]SEN95081.1 glucans biosynthesis protein [Pseudorhodobacter antarcticus]